MVRSIPSAHIAACLHRRAAIHQHLRGNNDNLSLVWLLQPKNDHYQNPHYVHFVDYKRGSSESFVSWVNDRLTKDLPTTRQLSIFDMHMRWINFTAHVRPRSTPLAAPANKCCIIADGMKASELPRPSSGPPLAGIRAADIHQRCPRPCCSAGFQLVLHQEGVAEFDSPPPPIPPSQPQTRIVVGRGCGAALRRRRGGPMDAEPGGFLRNPGRLRP